MSAVNGTSSIPTSTLYPADVEKGHGTSTLPRAAPTNNTTTVADFGSAPGNPASPLSRSLAQHQQQQGNPRFHEEWDASQRGSSILDGAMERSNSVMSQGDTLIPSRGGTLKKKASLKRGSSLRRSSSRRSSRAGSVRSLAFQPGTEEVSEERSAFYSPVPTTGNPTEILANRFQAWRKVLKDLITYFREIQGHYEQKSKSLIKLSNVINNTQTPQSFLESGGIDDALQILREHHKSSIAEANKSRDIENDVVLALVGLRSDLSQKIKEIKNLSGDFKNSVDKEMENTRKAVAHLQEGLGQSDVDPSQMVGKQDPYLLRLAVDRQVEKQIDEENYLHQAYLNLEASGRELEAIVVGEIQKSYNAYAGILKREADGAYHTVGELREGPIAMPKDIEWNHFVKNDDHFIDPNLPVRDAQYIYYPGCDNALAQEVRAGLMERKSKYLKSYTAGWYVLSPTHLHEFKSQDKTQAPIMSLYLPEQKLGSHSAEGGSSNKFMLKGRQTGALHRGHSWVFRCESMETMLAWYEDLKALTEKSPQERNVFVRQHARSVSGNSHRASSISSDGVMDDEDEEPYSANASGIVTEPKQDVLLKRPQPVSAERGLQAPLSPSSGSSGFGDSTDREALAAAGALPGSGVGNSYGETSSSPTHAAMVNRYAQEDGVNPYTNEPISDPSNSESHELAAGVIGAGVGAVAGAGLGSSGKPEEKQELERQAANESSVVAAPDTDISEHRAAAEAALIAAPDSTSSTDNSNLMSGGRSQDAVSPATDLSVTPSEAVPSKPLEDALKPIVVDTPTRPTLSAGENHMSVQSISQLHVPGEFPKGSSA